MQLEHAEGEVQALQDTCDAVTKRVALAENESAVFKQQHAELKEQLREVRTACRCAVGRAMRLGGANHDRLLWCRVFVLRLAHGAVQARDTNVTLRANQEREVARLKAEAEDTRLTHEKRLAMAKSEAQSTANQTSRCVASW